MAELEKLRAIMLIAVRSEERQFQILEDILRIPFVSLAFATKGAYDIVAFIEVESNMGGVMKHIQSISGIIQTMTNFEVMQEE